MFEKLKKILQPTRKVITLGVINPTIEDGYNAWNDEILRNVKTKSESDVEESKPRKQDTAEKRVERSLVNISESDSLDSIGGELSPEDSRRLATMNDAQRRRYLEFLSESLRRKKIVESYFGFVPLILFSVGGAFSSSVVPIFSAVFSVGIIVIGFVFSPAINLRASSGLILPLISATAISLILL